MNDNKGKFTSLLQRGRIGRLEIRNRMVMAPMGTYLAARDGTVTDRLKRYYEERARGGAGLIIIEIAAVDHPRGRGMTRQLGISEDKFIAGLSGLAEAIHKHGAKAGIQLHHGGRIAAPFLSGGYEAVAPSAIPLIPQELGMARELSVTEISGLIECFAVAATRAKQAGIDGVEIHAGHGYLIDQFLSRSSNFRQDKYGGNSENRARFLLETVNAVRQAVGPEYPVWCRIDGREYGTENGITPEESRETARKLEAAGIDALNVSGYGGSMGFHFTEAPLVYQPCFLMPEIQNIKEAVKVPLIAAGRIEPEEAEKILKKGSADFIAMGRPLLADPELPDKISHGKQSDIRKCIYCYTCVHQIFVRNNVCCTVNPAVGKESEPPPVPPQSRKKVLVAGSGPAGMAAAISAAKRGHEVTLVEKESRLGGSLTLAAIVRRENEDLLRYLFDHIKQMDIHVQLGTDFNIDLINKMHPDAVVIATGSVLHTPAISGIDSPRVVDGSIFRQILGGRLTREISHRFSLRQRMILVPALTLLKAIFTPAAVRRLTRLWMPLGRNIAILGGGMIGCELAIFLAERGRKVTIIEMSDQIATEMPLPMKWRTEADLARLGVTIFTEVELQEIRSNSLAIVTKEGSQKILSSDNIIVASGAEADGSLAGKMQVQQAGEIYYTGDCCKLGFIKDAIAEGSRIGSTI